MRKTFVPAVILAVSALAGAGLAATAAPTPEPMDPPAGMMGGPGEEGPGHHHFMMRHHWRPTEHLDGRLAYLKAELKIKSAQEGAWSDYAAALRKSAAIIEESMPEKHDFKQGERPAPLPVPARLDRAEQRLTAHLDALKAMKAPTKKLYDSLDDSQKKTADELIHGPMAMR